MICQSDVLVILKLFDSILDAMVVGVNQQIFG